MYVTAGESRCFQVFLRDPSVWMLTKTVRDQASVSEGASLMYLRRFTAMGICERSSTMPPFYRLSEPASEEGRTYLAQLKQSTELFPLQGVQS